MIRIFYGPARIDRDRFIFDSIRNAMPQDTVLLVPDQFTLQAERNAFRYMNTDSLFELSIMSRTNLVHRILEECGGAPGIPVNSYGCFMLMSRLVARAAEQEIAMAGEEKRSVKGMGPGLFGSAAGRRSFVRLMCEQISEFKQSGMNPEKLENAIDALGSDDHTVLREKLDEICGIYESFIRVMDGKFNDSDDLMKVVISQLSRSSQVRGKVFWLDNVSYPSAVTVEFITELSRAAETVNLVIADDGSGDPAYDASVRLRRMLRQAALDNAIFCEEVEIPEKYIPEREPEIHVMAAGDMYQEAESIAIRISELVREDGLRYSDIYLICNDTEHRGAIIKRIFGTYGIPLFVDLTRGISQDPAIVFLNSMTDVVSGRRRTQDVFTMLKTGYGPVDAEECELLENYCMKYNIRGGRWKNDFQYGRSDEGQEALARINDIRRRTEEFITGAEQLFRGTATVREKTESLWRFLSETAHIPEKLEEAAGDLESRNMVEYSERTIQIWKSIVDILDQIVEVLGDEVMTDEDFGMILREGFDSVQIGILPTNNDQVIMGSMPRSRTGRVKVVFAAGANEGELPSRSMDEGILSDEEKRLLTSRTGEQFGIDSRLRDSEQNLAIMKNLWMAENAVYVSYTSVDSEGSPMRPSELVTDILRKHPEVEIDNDYLREGDPDRLAQTVESASVHITPVLRSLMEGNDPDPQWIAVALALDGKRSFDNVIKGLSFSVGNEKMNSARVVDLFGRSSGKKNQEKEAVKTVEIRQEQLSMDLEGISGNDSNRDRELTLSTSAIEKYCRCPFSFFISRGLRPDEKRTFGVDPRSVGDIYHDCLCNVARRLTVDGTAITAENSPWMTVTEKECSAMVDECIDEFISQYREGVFDFSQREKYITSRIGKACRDMAWLMVTQVRCGNVRAIYFEREFSERSGALFPAVRIDLGSEGTVLIEGKIDRVDLIDAGDEQNRQLVKIIDYKSGKEKFDIDEVRAGWRLQLMIYLKGAMGGLEGSEPAGVFYFRVGENSVDVTSVDEEDVDGTVMEDLLNKGRMDGIFVEDETVINGIDGSFQNKSYVVDLRTGKDGLKSRRMLTAEEFDELIRQTDGNLERAGRSVMSGEVPVKPMKGSRSDACTYCSYRSICNVEIEQG